MLGYGERGRGDGDAGAGSAFSTGAYRLSGSVPPRAMFNGPAAPQASAGQLLTQSYTPLSPSSLLT